MSSNQKLNENSLFSLGNELTSAIDKFMIVSKTDTSGNISYANPNFCQISGYSQQELIGKNHRIVNSGYHNKEFFAAMWKTILSGKIWKGNVKNKRKNGSFYWVENIIVPIKDFTGQVVQFVSIRTDITDRINEDLAFEKEKIKLAQISQQAMIGNFSSGLSHEINNPLAILMGKIDILAQKIKMDDISKDSILNELSSVRHQAERILKIVKALNIISYHDPDPQKVEIFCLKEVLLEIFKVVDPMFKSSGVELELNVLLNQASMNINGNKSELVLALLNVINNAYDAVKNCLSRKVEIIAEDLGDVFGIRVVDTGVGVDRTRAEKIFDPFFTTKNPKENSGLGLSITKRIIDRHNGNLFFSSRPGNTQFCFTLPKAI